MGVFRQALAGDEHSIALRGSMGKVRAVQSSKVLQSTDSRLSVCFQRHPVMLARGGRVSPCKAPCIVSPRRMHGLGHSFLPSSRISTYLWHLVESCFRLRQWFESHPTLSWTTAHQSKARASRGKRCLEDSERIGRKSSLTVFPKKLTAHSCRSTRAFVCTVFKGETGEISHGEPRPPSAGSAVIAAA